MFLFIVGTVHLLAFLYLWKRLAWDTCLGRKSLAAASGLLLLWAALVPFGIWQGWKLQSEAGRNWSFAAYFAMGVSFYAFLLASVSHVVLRWLSWWSHSKFGFSRKKTKETNGEVGSNQETQLNSDSEEPDWERRLWLQRSAAGLTVAGSCGIGILGLQSVRSELQVLQVPVRLRRLPSALEGFKVIQLSDLHIGPLLGDEFLKDVISKCNAEKPDAVVITGDAVDGSVQQLGSNMAQLQKLKSRYGTYFVNGNHECYSDARAWTAFLETVGIRVLQNQHVVLGDPHPQGANFTLAGVQDWRGGDFGPDLKPDLQRALKDAPADHEIVLLAHQPIQIHSAADAGVGLQISGHTHGGQMWPFRYLTGLVQPYLDGLHLHQQDTQIYVSRGTGFWGPPMRVLAPAEITVLHLTS